MNEICLTPLILIDRSHNYSINWCSAGIGRLPFMGKQLILKDYTQPAGYILTLNFKGIRIANTNGLSRDYMAICATPVIHVWSFNGQLCHTCNTYGLSLGWMCSVQWFVPISQVVVCSVQQTAYVSQVAVFNVADCLCKLGGCVCSVQQTVSVSQVAMCSVQHTASVSQVAVCVQCSRLPL